MRTPLQIRADLKCSLAKLCDKPEAGPVGAPLSPDALWHGWQRITDSGECDTCYRRGLPCWQLEAWAHQCCALCMFQAATQTGTPQPDFCEYMSARDYKRDHDAWTWGWITGTWEQAAYDERPIGMLPRESYEQFHAREQLLGYEEGRRPRPINPAYDPQNWAPPIGSCDYCGCVVNTPRQVCPDGTWCTIVLAPPPKQGTLWG